MSVRLILAIAVAVLLSGCELPTDHRAAAADVLIWSDAGELVIHNQRSEPLHYVALEAEIANLIDLDPDHSAWPAIPPHSELRLAHAQLTGYHSRAVEAIVYLCSPGYPLEDVRIRF